MNFSFQKSDVPRESYREICKTRNLTHVLFLILLTLVHNQGIFLYNTFPSIFATKAHMNLILVPMDIIGLL